MYRCDCDFWKCEKKLCFFCISKWVYLDFFVFLQVPFKFSCMCVCVSKFYIMTNYNNAAIIKLFCLLLPFGWLRKRPFLIVSASLCMLMQLIYYLWQESYLIYIPIGFFVWRFWCVCCERISISKPKSTYDKI